MIPTSAASVCSVPAAVPACLLADSDLVEPSSDPRRAQASVSPYSTSTPPATPQGSLPTFTTPIPARSDSCHSFAPAA